MNWPAPQEEPKRARDSVAVNVAGTAVMIAFAAALVIGLLALAIKFWTWVL